MLGTFEKFESITLDSQIIKWEYEHDLYRFYAKLVLIDHSVLIIKDYSFSERRKYSFHWQDKDNALLYRWDNARHWEDIPTYPHHCHVGDEVLPSTNVTLEDILRFIEEKMKEDSDQ